MTQHRGLSVIKIGGNEAEDPKYLSAFAKYLHLMPRQRIIVHGGGKSVSAMQELLGVTPRFVDGQRYTDPETLQIAEMVLCGTSNKRLVRALLQAGHNALGISGMDAQIVTCDLIAELGQVGQPFNVRGDALEALLKANFVPVIAPLGLGDNGQALNVNADLTAAAIARTLHAHEVILLTNVPGIRIDGALLTSMDAEAVQSAITSGEIHGGMIPKVNAALQTAAQGIPVRICDLDGILSGGTTIHGNATATKKLPSPTRGALTTANL